MEPRSRKELYSTRVKPEEILYIVTNMTRLHEEGKKPDFFTAMCILSDRYRGRKNAIAKTFVITERLNCLSNLIKRNDERMPRMDDGSGGAGLHYHEHRRVRCYRPLPSQEE
jgi:hypothetical protein